MPTTTSLPSILELLKEYKTASSARKGAITRLIRANERHYRGAFNRMSSTEEQKFQDIFDHFINR